MATIPSLRNGDMPVRPTSSPSASSNPSLTAQSARLAADLAAKHQAGADNRPIRIVLPRHLHVEPSNLEKFLADDPTVGTRGAAIILGISPDLVKKWRQRGQGPDYYQFEEGGPIVYSVNALTAYKAAHLVSPRKKGRKQ